MKQLEDTQAQLQKAQADLAALKMREKNEEGDSLESYMSKLSSVGCVDKKQISKLKVCWKPCSINELNVKEKIITTIFLYSF